MIIITALMFANGFALFIAGLIIFMDRVINNYGICKIVINDDKEIHGPGGQTLLRVLYESKYFIPSACGGKGTCSYCKLKVLEGGGEILPTESLMLSKAEVKQHYRLACQMKVKNDLKVEIPPEYLEIQEYTGEISSVELLTWDIKRLKIKLGTPDSMTYKPGQYVQIKIPTGRELEFRAYSMASNPDDLDEIELNVKLIPEGIGSSFLHKREVGENIDFSGPYGDFYLRLDSERDIICVAGGVGLAPLKSIVSYWCAHAMSRNIYLFYGARTQEDLYDHEYFREIAKDYEKFYYFPALSEPNSEWSGDTGFIHTIVKREIKPSDRLEAYLCGPPIMIDAVTDVLKEKGIPEERILYDKF